MPFYTRHPLENLFLSDPFITSFLSPTHNRSREAAVSSSETREHGPTSFHAFSPNFDVHETPKEFVLEGELPGLEDKKKNLSIEFTDNNTLVVRGKIEKSYTAGTPPGKQLEGTKMKGAIEEGGDKEKQNDKSQQPTKGEDEKGEKKGDEELKYWVTERTVGSFQRSFSFPGEVDQDNVKASLESGILKIVVPKKAKRSAKKIDIC